MTELESHGKVLRRELARRDSDLRILRLLSGERRAEGKGRSKEVSQAPTAHGGSQGGGKRPHWGHAFKEEPTEFVDQLDRRAKGRKGVRTAPGLQPKHLERGSCYLLRWRKLQEELVLWRALRLKCSVNIQVHVQKRQLIYKS